MRQSAMQTVCRTMSRRSFVTSSILSSAWNMHLTFSRSNPLSASRVPKASSVRAVAPPPTRLSVFVLGVTSIDPVRQGLLFERFVSEERREPPDIDVDFEHERREEVIQWIYETYGRTRSALTAVVSRYRSRGAVREVGKALGLPEDVTGALASMIWGWSTEGVAEKQAKELNLNLEDRRLRLTLELAKRLIDTPRHLSQHPGGFVLTLDRLDEMVPVEPAAMDDRQVIEWDKDDIDAMKFMKVDVLGLGMLGCMRRAFVLLDKAKGLQLDLATIPAEDPATYAMIRKADTMGTFQIEIACADVDAAAASAEDFL